MKTITKKLFTSTLVLLPLGSVHGVEPRPQKQELTVDQILARDGFELNVIHDKYVKSFLVANDLDLEEVWEEQFPQDQPDGIMQSIASILGLGSSERNQGIDPLKTALLEGNFNDELRACLEQRLTTIRELVQTALQNPAPLENNPLSALFHEGNEELKERLTSAVLRYFKLENILKRASRGDEYILDLPSTPLIIVTSKKTNRILAFPTLRQGVKNNIDTERRINNSRARLFNNHRYDSSDPYWSEETTEQRKKLYSKIILGSMALGWCSSACAYKFHYDMVKAQKESPSQDKATEQRTTEATTPKIADEKSETVHKRARTRAFSWGSATSEPATKERRTEQAPSNAYSEYLRKVAEGSSTCPAKIKLYPDTCPRELEFELLDLGNLKHAAHNHIGENNGSVYKDQHGTILFLKSLPDDEKPVHPTTREFLGSRLLRTVLGSRGIARVRLIKDEPALVASEALPNFAPLYARRVYSDRIKGQTALAAGMDFVGLGDRSRFNLGAVEEDGSFFAARIDYDYSFNYFAPEVCNYSPSVCRMYGKDLQTILDLPQSYIEDTVTEGLNILACVDPSIDRSQEYTHIMDRLNENRQILKLNKDSVEFALFLDF